MGKLQSLYPLAPQEQIMVKYAPIRVKYTSTTMQTDCFLKELARMSAKVSPMRSAAFAAITPPPICRLLALTRAYLPACRRSFRSFLGKAAMWKTAIVCITLLTAQNLCAAEETNGWNMVFFVEILLAIAAAVGLAVAVAYIAGCFGNEVEVEEEEVETEEDESISR